MQTANTTSHGLNQWQPNDPLNTTQFNTDNQIIDTFMQNSGVGVKDYLLAANGWQQQENGQWNYAITDDPFFAENGYQYGLTVDVLQIVGVGQLGGIFLYNIPADESLILMCPKQPQEAISITITRQMLLGGGV